MKRIELGGSWGYLGLLMEPWMCNVNGRVGLVGLVGFKAFKALKRQLPVEIIYINNHICGQDLKEHKISHDWNNMKQP